MKLFFTLILSALSVFSAKAQFHLLKDANPGSGNNNQLFMCKLSPGTWITSWDGGAGVGAELWKTDGTAAGTEIIKDLFPGSGWGAGYGPDGERSVNERQVFFYRYRRWADCRPV